jgi:hypothetical protein
METGKDKAEWKSTATGRIDYVVGLLSNSENAEAIWWLEPIFSKHGSIADMHTVPFILAASWTTEDFDEILIWKLKSLAFTTSYPEFYFACSLNWVWQFRNLIKRAIELKIPDKSKEIIKEFEKAINKETWAKRVEKMSQFWSKYWTELVETITLNDGLIYADKNNDINKNDSQRYMESINWVYDDNEYSLKDEHRTAWDSVKNFWLYTFWSNKDLNSIATTTTWGFWWPWNWKITRKIFKSNFEALNAIKNNKSITEEKRKELFIETFKKFEESVSNTLWRFVWLDLKNSAMFKELKSKWLSLYEQYILEKWNEEKTKEDFYENMFYNFSLDWTEIKISTLEKTKFDESDWLLSNIIEKNKKAAEKTLEWKEYSANPMNNINKKTEEILNEAA